MTIARFTCLLACLVVLAASCQKPADHLPARQMEQVLTDIHLAEVYCTMVGRDSTGKWTGKNKDSLAAYYRAVFAHYHITAEMFTNSLDWYRGHPDQLDSIYSHILPQLSSLQGQAVKKAPHAMRPNVSEEQPLPPAADRFKK